MKNLLTIAALFFAMNGLVAQVEAELTIENQMVSGADFYFDIYLKTTPSTTGDLYLGNADFILFFEPANFGSPALTKVPTGSPGECNLEPTDPSGFNTLLTQINYFDNTAVEIFSDELRINLNGPTPSDQSAFDGRVAKIDGSASTHRLGRFKISNMTNPSASAGITWKTSSPGVFTQVFTLEPTPPFLSTAASLVMTNPVGCTDIPPDMTITPATAAASLYEAEFTVSTEGAVTVPDGAARIYQAGVSVTMNAEFEVELGADFEAKIEVCTSLKEEGPEETQIQ